MCKVLYLFPGANILRIDPSKNMFYHLSKVCNGTVIAPIRRKKELVLIKKNNLGSFNYWVIYNMKLPKLIRPLGKILNFCYRGLCLFYREKYDLIVTRGPWTTGFPGLLLKKITKTKLIIELRGNPKKAFVLEQQKKTVKSVLKFKIAEWMMIFVLNRADHIKLLYWEQLKEYSLIKNNKRSVFHDFVPINAIKPSIKSDKYILFMGGPWYLKGVDILIKAFKLISNNFPEYKLKIIGFCADKGYFQKLAEGNSKIELGNPVPHDEAIKLLSRCTLFILPSRTEAMGRVLLEAMACKKPIIASNVDGIPTYIKHEFNGLLFESENAEDLAFKISLLLRNPDFAKQLAENGYKYVHEYFSEKRYIENFKNMVQEALLA